MRTHNLVQSKHFLASVSRFKIPVNRPAQPLIAFVLTATLVAIIGLSSCAGYTSAAKTGPSGPGAGVLSASVSTLTFGSVAVGSNGSQNVTITNTGTATVNISQASMTGTGFSVASGNPSGSLAVGQSSTVQLQFAPTAPGAVSGALTVISDASNSPLMVSLSGTGTQVGLSISPSTLNFSNVTVGQTSTQNVTLANTGNTNVVINLATVAGNGFGISGLSLPKTISGGQSLSFNVQFAPTAAGAATGSITFTDNAPGSPQVLTMLGNGVSTTSTLTANPGSVNFGSVQLGSNNPQTITLTNTGTASATVSQVVASGAGFSISGFSAPQTIAAGQSTSFVATFTPTTAGAASGSITINSNANDSTVTVPLTGNGTQGSLAANPSSVSFGSVLVGSTGTSNVTLSNTGTASVTVSSATVTGGAFSVTGLSTPLTLTAGQTATFGVKFAPTTAGATSGSISIASNVQGSPLTIALSGTGTSGQAQLTLNPASVSFGNVAVGSTGTATVSLTNSGNATLTVTQAVASGAGFSMTGGSMPMTINAGSTASFTAVFKPTAAGGATGSISIVSNAAGSPATVALAGTGIQGQLTANPNSVAFGSVTLGTTATQTVTLTNSGSANVNISQIAASGTGFSVTGLGTPKTLGAGQTASFTAQFQPTTAGAASGSITITNDSPNSPISIALTGTGAQAQLSASPASESFGSVAAGSSSSQPITLRNGGTASLTISQISASGAGFSISGIAAPVTLTAGQTATFNAVYAPTGSGNATGSISIVSNAPNSPMTIALSGTGTSSQLSANPSSAAFGNVTTGQSNSQTITLSNAGTAAATISQVTFTGAGFSVSGISAPLTINAGSNAKFNVNFAPTAAGAVSGSVVITSNSPSSPLTIALSGTGVASTRVLSLSTTSLNFGSLNTGSSNSLSLSVTNTGNASVAISAVNVTGAGFTSSGVTAGEILSPNQSSTLTVEFAPTAGGAVAGSVSIMSNATNSPATISLSGTGVAAQQHTVGLTWNASTSSVVGYNVYRGTTEGGPYSTKLNTSTLPSTAFTDSSVSSGTTYYYVVTALDSNNDESTYSNEAVAAIQ